MLMVHDNLILSFNVDFKAETLTLFTGIIRIGCMRK